MAKKIRVWDGSAWQDVSVALPYNAVHSAQASMPSTAVDGQIWLDTDGTLSDTQYIPKTLTSTTGDIIYASSANTPARLGIGTSGQVLTVNGSGVPAWATASSGAYTQIATGSLGTGASFTISSIPATYQDLVLILTGYYPATAAIAMGMYFNGDSASNYKQKVQVAAATDDAIDTSPLANRIGSNMSNSGSSDNRSIITIPQYSKTVGIKRSYFDVITKADGATTSWSNANFSTIWNNTSAISSITIYPQIGNLAAGNYTLYGVK